MLVFIFMSIVSDSKLKQECCQESEIGQEANMRVFLNDELLTVKKRKDHRNDDRCSIVERVEQCRGKEDSCFHVERERYILNPWGIVNEQWSCDEHPAGSKHLFL
jgi:hypothetical protein